MTEKPKNARMNIIILRPAVRYFWRLLPLIFRAHLSLPLTKMSA